MSMQIVVTIVYWLMIHVEVTPVLKAQGKELFLFIDLYIHSVPLVTMSGLVLFSNIRFSAWNFPFTLIVSCVFVLVNFTACKLNGKHYYPFWPFNDVQSWITAAFLVTAASVCYVITALVVGRLPKAEGTANKKRK